MRHRIRLLVMSAIVLSTAAAYADLGDQLFKLLPDDGELNDWFGRSVAISGTTAIVGAVYDDDNGTESGSAYLFDTTTGQQIAKLLPDDGAEWDMFGHSVAISDTIAIVGAQYDDDNGPNSGSAYLFDTITGQQIAKLLPNDGEQNDWFGFSVAISRTTAIVGARGDDDNGNFSGSAYLFDIATGHQITKLLADDGEAEDEFGHSVAISGAIAIVGAQDDDDNGDNSGSAYLFDTTTGQQLAKLLPEDGAEDDFFGFSVAVGGNVAIATAWYDDDNGSFSGSAYLFDTTTGQQIAKLLPDDGAEWDVFGYSVAISGSIAIVGAIDDDNGANSGSAYLFDVARCIDPAECDDGLFCNGEEGCSEGICVSGLAPCDEKLCSEELDACVECLDDSHCNDSDACTQDACDPDTGACPHDPVECDDEDACTIDSCDPALGCQYEPLGCPGDLDCNGVIDATDLAILLGSWGPCPEPPAPCPADIQGTGDGIVGAGDLAVLLGNWGPCE